MRLLIYLITIFCAVAAFAGAVGIVQVDTTPVLDGDLSTGEWDNAFLYTVAYPFTETPGGFVSDGSTPSQADISADVYACWNEDYLYIAWRVYDNSLNWLTASGAAHNNQDAVQLGFNLLDNPDFTYRGDSFIFDFVAQTSDSAGASIYDKRNDLGVSLLPNAEIAASVLADGYIIEVALKWSDFNYYGYSYEPSVGDKHGVGNILADFDYNGDWTSKYMTDFGEGGSVTDASVYNQWYLTDADGCGLGGLILGDLTGNCTIDLEDFAILAAGWLDCTDPENPDCL